MKEEPLNAREKAYLLALLRENLEYYRMLKGIHNCSEKHRSLYDFLAILCNKLR